MLLSLSLKGLELRASTSSNIFAESVTYRQVSRT